MRKLFGCPLTFQPDFSTSLIVSSLSVGRAPHRQMQNEVDPALLRGRVTVCVHHHLQLVLANVHVQGAQK